MKKHKKKISLISKKRFILINLLIQKEKRFLIIIALCFLLASIFYPYPKIAMWLGFMLAAYSSVANDSIQTIGTFISSSGDRKWWMLWLYIGLIFLITVFTSWSLYNGDVTYQRLATKGFAESPSTFKFLQIAAPIFLLIITRFKMPVSTTFLLLSSFSSTSDAITSVLKKSASGYLIAFSVAFIFWISMEKIMKIWFKGKVRSEWVIFQWITSGFLWALWIMQDAANIAVFLPRNLNIIQFLIFSFTIFIGLGVIFYLKGDKIQEVVNEKTDVKDVRTATMIDLVYSIILILFTWINTVPMSTTWVFIGLLGGRELGIKIRKSSKLNDTWRLIFKDVGFALMGLVISIIIAVAANENLRQEVFNALQMHQIE